MQHNPRTFISPLQLLAFPLLGHGRRGKLQDRNCESARYPFDTYVGTYICYKDRRLGLTVVYLAISQFRCCVDGEIAR